MKAVVYRHFNAEGRLLYIGSSRKPFTRMATHLKDAAWCEQIANVTFTWYETEAEAQEAEWDAIVAERPDHNVVGLVRSKPADSGSNVFARVTAAVGTQRELARALGVTPQPLTKWKNRDRVPANRVLDVERISGISRHEIRPDVFGRAA